MKKLASGVSIKSKKQGSSPHGGRVALIDQDPLCDNDPIEDDDIVC